MAVTFAGTPIFDEVDDLCAQAACPIAPGGLEIEYVKELPPIAPPVSRVWRERVVYVLVCAVVFVCVSCVWFVLAFGEGVCVARFLGVGVAALCSRVRFVVPR